MTNQFFKPSKILSQYIDYYYLLETSNISEYSSMHRVYPYGNIILVFHYKNPFFFQKRDQVATMEPQTVICGQQTSYYDLVPSGPIGMIFIVFHPHGARMFFNIPMNEIKDKNLTYEYIVSNEALIIEEQIQNANCIKDRIIIIENYLTKKLYQNYCDNKRIAVVMNKINHNKGQISIKYLANMACLSIKQFERMFSSFTGINPKLFLRIIRFQNIIKKINNKGLNDLTQIAYECGYYDQSHFINDFKAITDLTPTEYIKKQIYGTNNSPK